MIQQICSIKKMTHTCYRNCTNFYLMIPILEPPSTEIKRTGKTCGHPKENSMAVRGHAAVHEDSSQSESSRELENSSA